MTERIKTLIERLGTQRALSLEEYEALIGQRTAASTAYLAQRADAVRRSMYGNKVFLRGLIEISNICKNDCYYCGIRKSNAHCERYRLTKEEILACCEEGNRLGLRTFVLQGGEDGYFTDDVLCDIIRTIKTSYPHCAVTLSVGERSRESYAKLRVAGADRYLLRHETACPAHYAKLHPENMSLQHRMQCLHDLKQLGYQVGCGVMVGSPGQTARTLAMDLAFIQSFQPQMVGMGPFIPHHQTPFAAEQAGDVDLTCMLLSIVRLICPRVLLPATTALATLDPQGHQKALCAGANVIMPNLSPTLVRAKYTLYNGKKATGNESAEGIELLKKEVAAVGYQVDMARGDGPVT